MALSLSASPSLYHADDPCSSPTSTTESPTPPLSVYRENIVSQRKKKRIPLIRRAYSCHFAHDPPFSSFLSNVFVVPQRRQRSRLERGSAFLRDSRRTNAAQLAKKRRIERNEEKSSADQSGSPPPSPSPLPLPSPFSSTFLRQLLISERDEDDDEIVESMGNSSSSSSTAPPQTSMRSDQGGTSTRGSIDTRSDHRGKSTSERSSISRTNHPHFDFELLFDLFMESVKEGNMEEMTKAQQEAAFDAAFNNAVFKRVLRDPQLLAPFQAFLEQQFCAENVNFYTAVEKYRKLFEKNTKNAIHERVSTAKKIYDRHFAPCSIEPVNVDNATSKKIRDLVSSETFLKSTFDIAQYQIFHLLKYDCWPRYLRSGGVAPQFTPEEENELRRRLFAGEEESENDIPRMNLGDKEDDSGERGKDGSPPPPTSPTKKGIKGRLERLAGSPSKSIVFFQGKSRIWSGFDRFSKKLRRGQDQSQSTSGETESIMGSPLTSSRSVQRTGSGRKTEQPVRRSYSSEIESTTDGHEERMSNRGAWRSPHFVTKYCTLMNGECMNERVALDDPSISVGKWTQQIATTHAMDKRCTEAVDAQTGATIDPCRQACDALQDRYVRLVPTVTFAIEIVSPTFSYKTASSSSSTRNGLTRVVMLRARQTLSAAAAMRPLLARYSMDFDKCIVVFGGSCEVVRPSLAIQNIGNRSVVIMSESQYKDRMDVRKELLSREGSYSSELAADHGIAFHQHGDIAYCELPFDQGTSNSSDNSLRRFVRRATQVVNSGRSESRRRSEAAHNPAGIYVGEELPEHRERKRLSLFKSRSDRDRSEGANVEKKIIPRPPVELKSAPVSPAVRPKKEDKFFQPKIEVDPPKDSDTSSNGDAPRTPVIFASKASATPVCNSSAGATPESSFTWQPAAYV
ncbi:hypothetical protein PMAYCL1PPCAC_33252 [Pristionchus mayeri]|uniref:RGS domain-containing protein n=1 Tax=Pristionchus mayeri TaxID=1317129 RepID=A0AAN5IE58_9BILA|nr:hypothetical protein PMAYCL1PPCAC_33252 [Pristionchus mayeri]